MAVALSIVGGVGKAAAADPTVVRSGCEFANPADEANHIQTCKVWSESMQQYVIVKVRPSDQQAGQQEQAVYFLGGVNDGGQNNGNSEYSTKYNLVMIQGSTSTWSSNWESQPVDADGHPLTTSDGKPYDPRWETFIGEELPAYLNTNFSVDESDNAIVGLSMSGGQAVNLALKYPNVFKVALSTSGYYQTDNPLGWLAVPYILATRSGIANGFDGMWGNPFAPGNKWAANDVGDNIGSARDHDQTIIVSTGNGIISSQAELDELLTLGHGEPTEVLAGAGLEFVSFLSALWLNAQAVAFDLPVKFIYTSGGHTWVRWNRTAAEEAEQVQDALTKYEVPDTSTPARDTAAPSASAAAPVVARSEHADESVTESVAPQTTNAVTNPPSTPAPSTLDTTTTPALATTTECGTTAAATTDTEASAEPTLDESTADAVESESPAIVSTATPIAAPAK
ncbi:alpha/beta hydrolase [Gordonia sp. DT219]|uniref:alpha/beta hydrolase n=1 Tax=Gordonia sp. DT219 TaxID=3416658 RepID=UPI003CF3195F